MQDYTDGEIVGIYRDGMNDPEIIHKLVELTLLSKGEILEILQQYGYVPQESTTEGYTDRQWWRAVQFQIMNHAYRETSQVTGIPIRVIRAEWKAHAARLGVLMNEPGERVPANRPYVPKKNRGKWIPKYSDDAWRVAIELRLQGIPLDEIAAQCGIPERYISEYWRRVARRLGITIPSRGEMARRDRKKRSCYTDQQWMDAVQMMLTGDSINKVYQVTGIAKSTIKREWIQKAEKLGIRDAYDQREAALSQNPTYFQAVYTDDIWRQAVEMKLAGIRTLDVSKATGIKLATLNHDWKRKAIQLGLASGSSIKFREKKE